jgi:hypothetical protein
MVYGGHNSVNLFVMLMVLLQNLDINRTEGRSSDFLNLIIKSVA